MYAPAIWAQIFFAARASETVGALARSAVEQVLAPASVACMFALLVGHHSAKLGAKKFSAVVVF